MVNQPFKSQPFRVFIGWDSRESLAYDVLCYSIQRHAKNERVVIEPLKHVQLRHAGYFARPWLTEAKTGNRIDLVDGKPFSTEFSHTRWLIPELCGFKGWALFMDCDMLFTSDIWELEQYCNNKYAAVCVKHRHAPKSTVKMDNQPQSRYERKNWSSFMLINCAHPANRALTKERVNLSDGGALHGFTWLTDAQIGELPYEYNWIEGSSPSNLKPKVIHYTEGGPWFGMDERSFVDGAFFSLWDDEYRRMRQYKEDLG